MVPKIDTPSERGTKEKIIDVSINLFAQRGFDAISMQEIADAVGIKKASLYYHFPSKDEILKQILAYPMESLGNMNQGANTEQMIMTSGFEGFMNFSSDLVMRWMDAPYVEKILRIIFVEMYHNDQIRSTFYDSFLQAATIFWEGNFKFMIEKKMVRPCDPYGLSVIYLSWYSHAWLEYFLLRYGTTAGSFRQEYQEKLNEHASFIVTNFKA